MKIIRLFMIWITVAGFAASLHAQTTQQVTAIQYYYNTDPGVGNAGNGAIVSVTPAANIDQVFSFNVPATLGNGFHYLYVRAQDELGRWSLTERRLFVIQSITATENITDYAYYFDTDPGVGNAGNGAIVPVTSTPNFSATVAITVPPSLTEGFHYLYVRTKDESGQWSLIERRLFVIQSITATENITDYAYYFDTDPGVGNPGNGAIVPVLPTANFSATVAITIPPSLTEGFHYLYVRTRDVSGQWSLTERRLFVTQAITPAEDITALEWYIDTDPGVGNGNPYPVVPTTGEVNATIDLGGVPCLSPGLHYLYVRAKNTAGRWSIIERLSLTLDAPEINVLGNAITINDGDATPDAADHTDFGTGVFTRSFTIQNTGTASLSITGTSVTGTNSSEFVVTTAPDGSIAAAGSTTFIVTFTPTGSGNRTAIIHIANNDCNEADYDFVVQGTGTPVCNLDATITTNNPTLYFGYTGDQKATITATPTGGTAPYTIKITMVNGKTAAVAPAAQRVNGRLICNFINAAGNEVWTPGANTLLSNGITCATNTVSASSTSNAISGSYSVTVTLLADARFIATVTDANGCEYVTPYNLAAKVDAEDVRCFAGNSGNVKVTLCHRTGSTTNPCVTICVDESAVAEHIAHGDFMGKCTKNCIAPVTNAGLGLVTGDVLSEVTEIEGFNVKAFPNPTQNQFTLLVESKSNEKINVVVYDVLGRTVKKFERGNSQHPIYFGKDLKVGAYFAEIRQGENRKTIKLVKQ